MKKQILFLTFLIAAITAGLNVKAQMKPSNVAPTPLTACTPSPLNPMAGQDFTYTVSNPNGEATAYTWWATKNPNFIDSLTSLPDTTNLLQVEPGQLLSVSTGYGDFTNTNTSITINWSADILAATEYQGTPNINATPASPSPTFVAVAATGDCNNNIEVYELNPMPSFTLDIANINPADTSVTLAYGTQAEQCVSPVHSAVYSGGQLNVDYGSDTLLFEVVAANFVTNWIPTFRVINGITSPQTATLGWAYSKKDAMDGNFIDGEQTVTVGSDIVGTTPLVADPGVNTATGVSIFVRVVIDNNNFESISDQLFTLAVDGQDASGQWDIDQAGGDCDETAADQTDRADHNITKRPDIQDDTNDGAINSTNDNTFVVKP